MNSFFLLLHLHSDLLQILVLSALVACTGSSQKEKPACVNTPVEPFTGLPVFYLQEQYPEKEIILQDTSQSESRQGDNLRQTGNFHHTQISKKQTCGFAAV